MYFQISKTLLFKSNYVMFMSLEFPTLPSLPAFLEKYTTNVNNKQINSITVRTE